MYLTATGAPQRAMDGSINYMSRQMKYVPSADPFLTIEKAVICKNCGCHESLHDCFETCPSQPETEGILLTPSELRTQPEKRIIINNMPVALKPPVQQPAAPTSSAPAPKCLADFQPDGTLVVKFTVSAEMAQRFVRQACGRDLATFLWDSRGLRHFEHQPLI